MIDSIPVSQFSETDARTNKLSLLRLSVRRLAGISEQVQQWTGNADSSTGYAEHEFDCFRWQGLLHEAVVFRGQ